VSRNMLGQRNQRIGREKKIEDCKKERDEKKKIASKERQDVARDLASGYEDK